MIMDKDLASLWFSPHVENQKLAIQIATGQNLYLDISYAIWIAYHDPHGKIYNWLRQGVFREALMKEMYNGNIPPRIRPGPIHNEYWLLQLRKLEDEHDLTPIYLTWSKLNTKRNIVLYGHAMKLWRIINKRSINLTSLYIDISDKSAQYYLGNETLRLNPEVLNLPIKSKTIITTAYTETVYDLSNLSKETTRLQLTGHRMIFKVGSFDSNPQLEELQITSLLDVLCFDYHLEIIGKLPNLKTLNINAEFNSQDIRHLIPLLERGIDIDIQNTI